MPDSPPSPDSAASEDRSREAFAAPTGTHDVLPPESAEWEHLIGRFSALAARAGYGLYLGPLFEDLAVFVRGVGQHTDVVTKEMYELVDKGGRRLALRPEVTAQVARAFVQHRPTVPWKVRYWGPQFRYERPQAGRYRQFHQLGVEALGSEDPELDVEVIALAWDVCADLGLASVQLAVNSLGDATCRPPYRDMLAGYIESRSGELCAEHVERWKANPLRVLDCKRDACRRATEDAPAQVDHLCEPCRLHWQQVLEGLDDLSIPHEVRPRLVRGLDYYTRTTFELSAVNLASAQDAVGGGGRYDGLVEALGGPATPGIGFSMGLERLMLALRAERDAKGEATPVPVLDAFVVDLANGAAGRRIVRNLRTAGLSADRSFGKRSAKAQFKAADRSGAAVAVIVGPAEQEKGTVSLRPLRACREERTSVAGPTRPGSLSPGAERSGPPPGAERSGPPPGAEASAQVMVPLAEAAERILAMTRGEGRH
ncbi:MAG: histidine--tRNA ligase [Actinomycetota bacterium]|nr:histidine--tRNA ligase [Actinomycetota bacterium]